METGKRSLMSPLWCVCMAVIVSLLCLTDSHGANFESGSSCGAAFFNSSTCRGAFSPVTNTTVALPPSGILDYTTYYIPYGVTVSFTRNAANTPVIIRTSGDVKIEGALSVTALTGATNSGTYGDGNLGDDGQPGTGGPGGSDGGYGGFSALFGGAIWQPGGAGKGIGGGQSGGYNSTTNCAHNGGGGGFGAAGGNPSYATLGGIAYGQSTLLPLIGGSGGAGGGAGSSYNGAGGGGGGGAIMIAAGTATTAATITVGTTANSSGGRIYADGGAGGRSSGSGCGGAGGGGSGGAIRLVANTLVNPNNWGWMQALGGTGYGDCCYSPGNGSNGIIRLESNNITGWTTGRTNPAYSFGLPGHVLVPHDPTLLITSVTPTSGTSSGSVAAVPAVPTGNADITFPTGTTTATVNLVATGIPAGSTATVHVIPANGAVRTQALSGAFSVPDGNGVSAATATVTLSSGNNVLQAAVTYTVTELVAQALPQFNGEYVARIRVEGGMGGDSRITYITASGREYVASRMKG